MSFEERFMDEAVSLAFENMSSGNGGPFGALVVRNGVVVARGHNQVTQTMDPTAHAEVTAIRHACHALQSFQLTDCDVYSSCEPCPMCLAALYWARPRHVYFAATKLDAARAGFDDEFIYEEFAKPLKDRRLPLEHRPHPRALDAFNGWLKKSDKIEY